MIDKKGVVNYPFFYSLGAHFGVSMIYMEIVDHDELFRNLPEKPIVANDHDFSTIEGRELLSKLLYTKYEGDSLNITPKCFCGNYKSGDKVGLRCPVCNTICHTVIDQPLESLVWMRKPDGVAAFINPTVWVILSNAMTINGCNILQWMCDPLYKPPGTIPPKIRKLESLGIKRSLNALYENFDQYMDLFFINPRATTVNKRHLLAQRFIKENRHKIFSDYLPMPSKVAFVVESNDSGIYADKTMTLAIDALSTITSINDSIRPLDVSRKQNRTVRAIMTLAEFYVAFTKKLLSGKYGIFRKHIFGGRLHFTARAVISSLHENHDYDELHIPWSLSLQLFRVHLANKLLRLGMSPIQIERKFADCAFQYDPLLDKLLQELISESPYKGIPVVFQRNPTLKRGSAQALYITKVKTDVKVNTISFSCLCLKAPNADFDGDEMNLTLILDDDMHRRLQRLAPHLGVMDLKRPFKVSSNLAMPPPVVSTQRSWLYPTVH